jgi:hypothetical protein
MHRVYQKRLNTSDIYCWSTHSRPSYAQRPTWTGHGTAIRDEVSPTLSGSVEGTGMWWPSQRANEFKANSGRLQKSAWTLPEVRADRSARFAADAKPLRPEKQAEACRRVNTVRAACTPSIKSVGLAARPADCWHLIKQVSAICKG